MKMRDYRRVDKSKREESKQSLYCDDDSPLISMPPPVTVQIEAHWPTAFRFRCR